MFPSWFMRGETHYVLKTTIVLKNFMLSWETNNIHVVLKQRIVLLVNEMPCLIISYAGSTLSEQMLANAGSTLGEQC